MIFKSEATKTFINVDDIVFFNTRNNLTIKGNIIYSANILFKNGGDCSVTLPQEEMDQLWKMICDNMPYWQKNLDIDSLDKVFCRGPSVTAPL